MKAAVWFRKSLVILVSVLTFGLVTPSDLAWLAEADSLKDTKKGLVEEEGLAYLPSQNSTELEEEFNREEFLSGILNKAEENAFMKFGEKINPKIGDEFKMAILPKMEEAITEMAAQYPDEKLQQLTITEQPSAGRAEKIFHIYDSISGKDIIRFHVRQENPPLEGYWFDFHYHTYHDSFATHYNIGKIYWDKNTPPEWTSKQRLS
ncbi:YpjP family protein [Peribacillus simplex]|uniref:YpjP-like protein n=1 Tax=Peribacillus simplex TaxID=1478 RepID=A0A9X8R5D4_9BACI|nr:YpjP family protein [Peribacillus simplex]WHY54729.1 YpjP family protein [Peribacillus simplex]SIQ45309.1 YpjP-like protein [Peribacillus simplex]